MDRVIIDRYVRALYNAARNASEEYKIERDLIFIKNELYRSGIKDLLENPIYSFQLKLKTIEKLENIFSSSFTVSFLQVLLRHSRIYLLKYIPNRYVEIHRESKGIAICELTFSINPSEKFLYLIENELHRITRQQVELMIHVDPDIVGGVCLKIKNHVLDGTLRKGLELLRYKLLHSQEIYTK